MQLSMDFYKDTASRKEPVSIEAIKAGLEEHIKTTGLVAYKDFYMRIKSGAVLVPEGISKEDYLTIAREVYESRAAKVNRDISRRRYFAIKNKNRKTNH